MANCFACPFSSSPGVMFGFTSEQQDFANNLVYLRARYYNPALGRFLTPDSLIPDVTNGQSLNAYAYVTNDPINLVDPSGNIPDVGSAIVSVAKHLPTSWQSRIHGGAAVGLGGLNWWYSQPDDCSCQNGGDPAFWGPVIGVGAQGANGIATKPADMYGTMVAQKLVSRQVQRSVSLKWLANSRAATDRHSPLKPEPRLPSFLLPIEFVPMTGIDYLLIGHITRDLTPTGERPGAGERPGGTVTYSGRTAAALGCHTAVLTSAAPDFAGLGVLAGLQVVNVPAEVTTTFENVYTPHGRAQTVHAVANTLTPAQLPADWRHPAIVHLAPVVHEVDPGFISHFPNSLVCLTPQGWLREWGQDGRVRAREWAAAAEMLSLVDIIILSDEDLPLVAAVWRYWEWSKLLVLTGGEKGCVLFQGKTAVRVPARSVAAVELTGAGDIFAAAFFIHYHQTRDAPAAAHFANTIAAGAITQTSLETAMKTVKWAVENYVEVVT